MTWSGLRRYAHINRRGPWTAVITVFLLFPAQHATDLPVAKAHRFALDHTWDVLQKVQNELGPRSPELDDVGFQLTLGLTETRRDPLRHSEWLRAQWFYCLLRDDHARARDAIAASRAQALEAHASPDWIATVTNELSYSLILLGEVAKAKELLREAIVLASQRNDPSVLSDQYYSMADAYRKTGERTVARRYFEAALQLDRASGDESRQVGSELRLGSIARDSGAIQEAVERHKLALSAFHREGNFREIMAELELARDYAALRMFDLAEAYSMRARQDRRSLLEQRMEASILMLQIANDRRMRGIATPAAESRASDLIREIDGMITTSTQELASEFSHPTRQVQFYEQAIRHYTLDRNLDQVSAKGQRAVRLIQHVAAGLSATNDDVLAWLSNAQPLLDEYVSALYELDRSQVFPLLETYYSDPVALEARRQSNVVARAYETEAVELFDRYRTAQQRVVDATVETERLEAFASRAAHDGIERLGVDQLLLQRDLARDAYLAVQTLPSTAVLPSQDAEAFRSPVVPPTDVLVRYFVQERVSFGVVLGGGEPEYFELPPRSEVVDMIQRALHALATPTGGDTFDRAPLSALATLLPPDLLVRHRDATRLIVVADDAVQLAPFAAIDIAEPSQPYTPLAGRFELVRTKSAVRYFRPVTAIDTVPGQADVVIFANPSNDARAVVAVRLNATPVLRWAERLPSLPETAREADVISRLFNGRAVKTYVGSAATSDALLSVDARAAKVLHIATHGYFNRTSPDLVGLVTSATTASGGQQGGFVGLTELFTRHFASRLVVISGCETMRGMDYHGWSGGSLADGFLTQGAGSVIGMLWKVSDDATAQLMIAFYRQLSRNGGNSSQALHDAQRELMKSRLFGHPYYWAGAVLESSNRGIDQHVL
jgi:CHAT domain-containing protein/tetratricopeptide (TPR) repeat protein